MAIQVLEATAEYEAVILRGRRVRLAELGALHVAGEVPEYLGDCAELIRGADRGDLGGLRRLCVVTALSA